MPSSASDDLRAAIRNSAALTVQCSSEPVRASSSRVPWKPIVLVIPASRSSTQAFEIASVDDGRLRRGASVQKRAPTPLPLDTAFGLVRKRKLTRMNT